MITENVYTFRNSKAHLTTNSIILREAFDRKLDIKCLAALNRNYFDIIAAKSMLKLQHSISVGAKKILTQVEI